jgi:hypothetical protein
MNVTGIFLSGNLGQANRFDMTRAVVSVLPDIFTECSRADRGSRFRIIRDRGNFSLTEWPVQKGEMAPYS